MNINDDLILLTDVPVHYYKDFSSESTGDSNQHCLKDKLRQVTFDIAIWLKFEVNYDHPLSAWIEYRDTKKKHRIFIDKGILVTGKHLMLSGRKMISFKGKLSDVKILSNDINLTSEDFIVDELHFKKVSSNNFAFEIERN